MKLTFHIDLNSDYHIGAGFGIGSIVDSALLRDRDHVPALRGSTLEGLFRDGLWRLLQTPSLKKHFDDDHLQKTTDTKTDKENENRVAAEYCNVNPCPICQIFGTPASPKSWRFSSARPIGVLEQLEDDKTWKRQKNDAQMISRNTINLRSRRTEPKKLFSQEEGSQRLSFEFTVDYSQPSLPDGVFSASQESNTEEIHRQAALLVAAARMVRRFGAARRRGRGACTIKLIHVDGWQIKKPEGNGWQPELLDAFKTYWLKEKSFEIKPPKNEWKKIPASKKKEKKRFYLLVRADEPIVASNHADAGNYFESLPFINGSMLIGALARLAITKWDISNSEVYEHFLDIFRRGFAAFSPLYPANLDDNSFYVLSIPTPLDMLKCKSHQRIDNSHFPVKSYAAIEDLPDTCTSHLCKKSKTPLVSGDGFVAVTEGLRIPEIQLRDELHPQINPTTQRVKTGRLFGYVALEARQFFMGVIECESEADWKALSQLSGILPQKKFSLRLGKGTGRGYGAATAWLQEMPSEVDPWRGQPLEKRIHNLTENITMTLLSDCVLPDTWGRCKNNFSTAFLQELLAIKNLNVQINRQFCRTRLIDGFNNVTGLPRWRDIAMRAGSAVGFSIASSAGLKLNDVIKRLKEIERDGIGFRRHEGFGLVAFNHPLYFDAGVGIAEEAESTGLDIGIKWPEALQTPAKPKNGAAKTIFDDNDFLNRVWEESLKNLPALKNSDFEDKKWDAVARWLWRGRAMPIAELKQELDKFGKTENLTDIERGKDNQYYSEKSAERAMKQIKKLLDQLTDKSEFVRSKAIQALAGRISLAARKEAQP